MVAPKRLPEFQFFQLPWVPIIHFCEIHCYLCPHIFWVFHCDWLIFQYMVPNPSTGYFYLNSIVRDLTVFSNKFLSLSGLAWIAWNWVGFKLRTSSALESCTCLLALNLSAFSELFFSAEQKDCDKKDCDPVKTLAWKVVSKHKKKWIDCAIIGGVF